ncbi:hypothetical protein C8R47DRAFT_1077932 [Mycena vitilis]|nr:hypothetical protein C8R47DRAFT_1077932 [Mycena vitilis]
MSTTTVKYCGTEPSGTAPSSESDLLFTGSRVSPNVQQGADLPAPAEVVLDGLFANLLVPLTAAQKDQYAAVRAMLTTGRTALLSTSALVAGQLGSLEENTAAIERVRKDTEVSLQALHRRVLTQETQVEQTLSENVRILRAFGSTEEQLEQLTRSMAVVNHRHSPKPEIPLLPKSALRSVSPLSEFQGETDSVLPPRGPAETADAFYRRGTGVVNRNERTATAFTVNPTAYPNAPSASAAHFAKNARFEDVGSISTAHRAPYTTYTGSGLRPGVGNVSAVTTSGPEMGNINANHAETFHQDQEKLIRRIAHREIGEALNLPSYIRSVKVDAPPKYKGDDDLDIFMKFVELQCTWMRSQMICGYEPSVDKYRTSILKGNLEGQALDWFILNISNPHFEPERELTFTETLCALHQRFITSSNAQRATRAFDAVRFDLATGPDAFAEQLLRRAHLMRHVPDEFAINQRFIAGLPRDVRYKMKVDKEMTAEYTPFSILRQTARHLCRTMNEDSHSTNGNTRPSVPTKASTPAVHLAPRRNPAPSPVVNPTTTYSHPTRTTGTDERTCYKCGAVGHIAANPKCPKYNDPAIVPGARVGAQRVLESYADGSYPDDEYAGVEAQPDEGDGDYEGLWGGAQYQPEEDDPNVAPDMADLAALTDTEEPVRVGALRAQYYSMRIPEVEQEEDGERLAPVPGRGDPDETAAILDLEHLELRLPANGVYRDWDPAVEAQQELAAATAASQTAGPSFDSLLSDFQSRTGNRPLSPSLTMELEAIYTIGTEEAAREAWRAFIPQQPPMRFGYSRAALRTTAVNVLEQEERLTQGAAAMRDYRHALHDLLNRQLAAHDEISRLRALPSSAASVAGDILLRANNLNVRLSRDLDDHIVHVHQLLQRLLEALQFVHEELTRRMLAREAYAAGQTRVVAPSSSERSTGSRLATVDEDDSSSPSVPVADDPPESPPPALGTTPPPSYPGTPESAGSPASTGSTQGMWDVFADPNDSFRTVSVSPSPPSPVFISDSEDEDPLRLQTNRLLTPVLDDTGLRDEHGGITAPAPGEVMVEETYSVGTPSTTSVDRDPVDGEPPRMISRALYKFGGEVEHVTTFLRADVPTFV